jgi:CheY-like chemotaxis protein
MLQDNPEVMLLFTDLGLPGGLNGRQLADAARRLRPDLKILFTTGYARNAIVHDGRLDPGVVLIPKDGGGACADSCSAGWNNSAAGRPHDARAHPRTAPEITRPHCRKMLGFPVSGEPEQHR